MIKVCYVAPECARDSDSHFAHLPDLLEELGRFVELAIIVQRGKPDRLRHARRIYTLRGRGVLGRALALLPVIVSLRLAGYRTIFVRVSVSAAIAAGVAGRLLGMRVFLWHSGQARAPAEHGSRPLLLRWRDDLLVRAAMRVCSRLVTGPRSMADYYAARYGVPAQKISVLSNDVNVAKTRAAALQWDVERARRALGVAGPRPVVLFVGRVSRAKGGEHIVPLAARLRAAFPDVVLVVAGHLHRNGFAAEVAAAGLAGNIQILGPVANTRVPALQRAADVFVLPSNLEGFPRTLLEAMACGTPPVAFAAGGVREIVGPGLNDWTTAVGDVEGMAQRVIALLRDPQRRRIVSRLAVDRVQQFDTPRVAGDLARLLSAGEAPGRLRVCNVAKHIYPPSLRDHAQNLETFRALGRHFEEIHLIVQSADAIARTEHLENIHVRQLPRIAWSGTLNHIVFVIRAFRHAHRLISAGRVDVCDGSEPLSGGVVVRLLRWATGVPYLVELQGDMLDFETGLLPPLKEFLFRAITRSVVRRADHVRAISERVAAQATRAGVQADRITVATSRVNLQRFRGRGSTGRRDAIRQRYDLDGRPVVGYLGRLHPLKGLRTLVQAWPVVAAAVPEAALVIVGNGPEYRYLRALAAGPADRHRIVLAGACHYDDVPAWLDAFDLFVLPSFTEGTPRALLEAMAMELPVVATSVGDIADGVLTSSSGEVVPPGDAAALADAILRLLADPERAAALGNSARATVLRRFEFDHSILNLARAHYRAAGRRFPGGEG
jgi:glycosyltransferase involved in cell wall biosynthesis